MQTMRKTEKSDPLITAIDPNKLELLRKRLLLSKSGMASIFGVSRVTYHGWLDGRDMRKSNYDYVKSTLRRLVALIKDSDWPDEGVKAMTYQQRRAELDRLLEQYD